MQRPQIVAPVCPYCRKPAVLFTDSSQFYHGRDFGPVWACLPCRAWVGCHKNSPRFAAKGRLANAELRKAKIAAHGAFDPVWRQAMQDQGLCKIQARDRAYQALAKAMKLPRGRCHIGMMDLDQCRQVVALCEEGVVRV